MKVTESTHLIYLSESSQFKMAATAMQTWQTQKTAITLSFTDIELKCGLVVTEHHLQYTLQVLTHL